ncbi:unnamed protein product [marine sediment metagenome]|jgi:hypothetical protein|uniref:Uncharacterized protein n=1 Tax=marine sediment metagenome TaxID=412755 RepID=X1N460_9ZZZZ
MAVLTMSGQEMIDRVAEGEKTDAAAFADLMVALGNYRVHLEYFLKLIRSAERRVMVTLCYREDCMELLQEARQKKST